MRRDSIFDKLFQQSPTLLFELLTNPPANACEYKFDSVAVKLVIFYRERSYKVLTLNTWGGVESGG